MPQGAGLFTSVAAIPAQTAAVQCANPASQITNEARSNSDYVWTGGVDVARSYTVNGLNQYGSAGPASFTYDANGNLTSDGTSSYVYDAENRLVSSSASGGTQLSYDPLGRLWQTSSPNTGITRFVYEGDHVAVEYDGAGAMLRRYFWGPGADEPILQDEGGQLNCSGTRFFHLNHQSSTIAVADCWGNRVATNRYDEYGVPNRDPQGTVTNWGRFQYTGQTWLPELGMYYYKARMYSATLGRFLQTDPIGYDDQVNLYAYVRNDPINKTDPLGTYICRASEDNCKAVAAALARARDALKSDSLSKSDRRKISQLLRTYGDEGRKNGVVVADAGKAWLSKYCTSGAACAFSAGSKRGSWTVDSHTVVLPKNFSSNSWPQIQPINQRGLLTTANSQGMMRNHKY